MGDLEQFLLRSGWELALARNLGCSLAILALSLEPQSK
jgi:hypothetical protein